jgi:hypothetical protein
MLARKPPVYAEFQSMTLCIAAIYRRDGEEAIIAASDFLLSNPSLTLRFDTGAYKFTTASPTHRWITMFAGIPYGATEVWNCTRERLQKRPDSSKNMRLVYRQCVDKLRKEKAVDRLLRPQFITLSEFKRNGPTLFPGKRLAILQRKLRDFDFGTEFLVAGLDPRGVPDVFTITGRGDLQSHISTSCAAIGCGSDLAIKSFTKGFNPRFDWTEIVYRVCIAKFGAELDRRVGDATTVVIIDRNGVWKHIFGDGVEEIRSIWKRLGGKPLSQADVDLIAGLPIKGEWKKR